jgi:hypothetical protein
VSISLKKELNFLVKQSFNKNLELFEFFENLRFVLKQIDPSELAEVINKMAYPVFMSKPCTHHMHDPSPIVPHIWPKSVHR